MAEHSSVLADHDVDASARGISEPVTAVLQTGPSDKAVGIVAGCASAILFALMAFAVHQTPPQYPSSELAFVRALLGILVLGVYIRGAVTRLVGRGTLALWSRSLFGCGSVFCYYWTLRRVSVGDSTIMADMSPIFVLGLTMTVMRVRPKALHAIAVVLIVLGAILLSKGGGPEQISTVDWTVGLGGALLGACAYYSLSKAAMTFTKSEIVFCFSVVMALFALATPGPQWIVPPASDLWLFAVVGVCGLLAQIVMTVSYKYLKPEFASSLILSSCFFGSLFEAVANQRLPSLLELGAYVPILAGLLLIKVVG